MQRFEVLGEDGTVSHVNASELKQLARSSAINEETPVRFEGSDVWRKASDVKGLTFGKSGAPGAINRMAENQASYRERPDESDLGKRLGVLAASTARHVAQHEQKFVVLNSLVVVSLLCNAVVLMLFFLGGDDGKQLGATTSQQPASSTAVGGGAIERPLGGVSVDAGNAGSRGQSQRSGRDLFMSFVQRCKSNPAVMLAMLKVTNPSDDFDRYIVESDGSVVEGKRNGKVVGHYAGWSLMDSSWSQAEQAGIAYFRKVEGGVEWAGSTVSRVINHDPQVARLKVVSVGGGGLAVESVGLATVGDEQKNDAYGDLKYGSNHWGVTPLEEFFTDIVQE